MEERLTPGCNGRSSLCPCTDLQIFSNEIKEVQFCLNLACWEVSGNSHLVLSNSTKYFGNRQNALECAAPPQDSTAPYSCYNSCLGPLSLISFHTSRSKSLSLLKRLNIFSFSLLSIHKLYNVTVKTNELISQCRTTLQISLHLHRC